MWEQDSKLKWRPLWKALDFEDRCLRAWSPTSFRYPLTRNPLVSNRLTGCQGWECQPSWKAGARPAWPTQSSPRRNRTSCPSVSRQLLSPRCTDKAHSRTLYWVGFGQSGRVSRLACLWLSFSSRRPGWTTGSTWTEPMCAHPAWWRLLHRPCSWTEWRQDVGSLRNQAARWPHKPRSWGSAQTWQGCPLASAGLHPPPPYASGCCPARQHEAAAWIVPLEQSQSFQIVLRLSFV